MKFTVLSLLAAGSALVTERPMLLSDTSLPTSSPSWSGTTYAPSTTDPLVYVPYSSTALPQNYESSSLKAVATDAVDPVTSSSSTTRAVGGNTESDDSWTGYWYPWHRWSSSYHLANFMFMFLLLTLLLCLCFPFPSVSSRPPPAPMAEQPPTPGVGQQRRDSNPQVVYVYTQPPYPDARGPQMVQNPQPGQMVMQGPPPMSPPTNVGYPGQQPGLPVYTQMAPGYAVGPPRAPIPGQETRVTFAAGGPPGPVPAPAGPAQPGPVQP